MLSPTHGGGKLQDEIKRLPAESLKTGKARNFSLRAE